MIYNYKGKYDLRHYEVIFKGKLYSIEFIKYAECISIRKMVYICDSSQMYKENPLFFDKEIEMREPEYQQIEILLRKDIFGEMKK